MVNESNGSSMSSGQFLDRHISEKKTEIYRNYLEENAVLEAMTKALSKMYVMAERPANPMEFIIKELNGAQPGVVTNMAYRTEYDNAMKEIEKLKKEVEALKKENNELKEAGQKTESNPSTDVDTVD